MPRMTARYCKTTPVKNMGFSQKASCKAQGLIARSDGKKRKSPKYSGKKSSRKVSRKTSRKVSRKTSRK